MCVSHYWIDSLELLLFLRLWVCVLTKSQVLKVINYAFTRVHLCNLEPAHVAPSQEVFRVAQISYQLLSHSECLRALRSPLRHLLHYSTYIQTVSHTLINSWCLCRLIAHVVCITWSSQRTVHMYTIIYTWKASRAAHTHSTSISPRILCFFKSPGNPIQYMKYVCRLCQTPLDIFHNVCRWERVQESG